MTRRAWMTVGLLTGLALALRLLVLWRLPAPELSGDALNYTRMATQLINRHVYGYLGPAPDAYVTPGYPLFLTAIQWFAGNSPAGLTAARLAQALLGALTLVPFFLLARNVAGNRAALWTGLMLAFYPAWVRAPAYLLTETLFTFAFGWYLWVQVRALQDPGGWRWPAATGLLLGLAVLVRPVVVPLLVLPWLYLFIRGRELRPVLVRVDRVFSASQPLRAFGFAAAGFTLALLPWWARNVISLHQWIFLATQTGNPILGGMDPYGLWHGALWSGVGRDTGQQLTRASSILFWLVRHYPWLTLKWFTVGKLSQIFLSPWLGWDLPTLSQVHYPVVVLGWLGALAALRRHGAGGWQTSAGQQADSHGHHDSHGRIDAVDPQQFLSLVLICLTLIQLAFIPESRYAYPLIGILAVFGAVALTRIFTGGEPDVSRPNEPALAGRGPGV